MELAFLEIEELDGITKYKEERNDVGEMDEHDIAKEVMPDPEIILQELLHHHGAPSRNWEQTAILTKLRRYGTIDGPGDWVGPLVPPPPNWYCLQQLMA